MSNTTGNILFHLSISHEKLDQLLNTALDDALSKEKMEVNGVEVEMQKMGDASVRVDKKELFVDVPLDIQVRRKAGLFSVEGTGKIALNIQIDYDITNSLQLKCKSKIESYNWLTKPRLEIGALSIPIETLLNLVLDHQESIISGKIDHALNNMPDIGGMLLTRIEDMERRVNDSLPFESMIFAHLKNIDLLPPVSTADEVLFEGALYIDVTTEEIDKCVPTIRWKEEMSERIPLGVNLQIGYEEIARLIVDKLSNVNMSGRSVKLTNLDISYDDKLIIQADILEPIKGEAFVTGIPVFDPESGLLDVKDLNIKVNPSNIIYKLTTPLVNSFLRSKTESNLPISIQSMLDKALEALPKSQTTAMGEVKLSVDCVNVDHLEFSDRGITIIAYVNNMDIQAKIL